MDNKIGFDLEDFECFSDIKLFEEDECFEKE